jgi:hypothetical protein
MGSQFNSSTKFAGFLSIAFRPRCSQDSPAKCHDSPHYFVGGFEDSKDLPGSQRDDSIRRDVDVLYQIGVQNERHAIQAREADHGTY